MEQYQAYFEELGKRGKEASYVMQTITEDHKNKALLAIADAMEAKVEEILEANALDMKAAEENQVPTVMLDRLLLTEERIKGIAEGVRQVANLPDPIGECMDTWTNAKGLHIEQVRVPIGVIAMIYEARPNVTVDSAVLALKTGNVIILRGGKEAYHSSRVYTDIMREALETVGLPQDAVQLVDVLDREAVPVLLNLRQWIDVVIPRGGAGLIQRVVQESSIPVIETGSGVVHVYVDKAANWDFVLPIIMNAKTQRPSVCNAMETLLIHSAVAPQWLPKIVEALREGQVELHGDSKVVSLDPTIVKATEEQWHTEYNDLVLDIKMVDSLEEAIAHINQYGTKHSEAIITDDEGAAKQFTTQVDASTVYVNASTRFTDGFEFGFGAEIGISTQKLHARGPMGIQALTSYKYVVVGQGQVRQ